MGDDPGKGAKYGTTVLRHLSTPDGVREVQATGSGVPAKRCLARDNIQIVDNVADARRGPRGVAGRRPLGPRVDAAAKNDRAALRGNLDDGSFQYGLTIESILDLALHVLRSGRRPQRDGVRHARNAGKPLDVGERDVALE